MPVVKPASLYVSEDLPNVVPTGAAVSTGVAINAAKARAGYEAFLSHEKWQQIIDENLIEWGSNSSHLANEGIEPPTALALKRATDWVMQCRESAIPSPQSVVLDPHGGIVFERREGKMIEVMHFWDDGTADYLLFIDSKIVKRYPM